jgi:hypothetical protein
MRKVVFSLALWGASTVAFGQTANDTAKKATVVADTNIMLLDQWKTDQAKASQKMDGFIILIGSESGANSKSRAYNKQQAFTQAFPEIPTQLVWKNPNYQVTAGAYRTRLEAEKAIKVIIEKYPAALIMPAKIDFIPTH